MDYWLIGELAFTGALVGLMYALVAVGIVLVYKTSGVANFAQGAIAMTGGYATWAISAGLGLPMWAAIPLALAMMFALGMLIERAVLQHMIGQPVIMIIMVTFGIEIFLRGIMPGTFGVAVKRLSLDIPQAPIFLGEMLINRAYLVGGGDNNNAFNPLNRDNQRAQITQDGWRATRRNSFRHLSLLEPITYRRNTRLRSAFSAPPTPTLRARSNSL